jgi:hypothetical protein
VLRATPPEQHHPIVEHIQFQTANAWNWVLRCMDRIGVGTVEERNIVTQAAMQRFAAWLETRTVMTLTHVAPQPFPF